MSSYGTCGTGEAGPPPPARRGRGVVPAAAAAATVLLLLALLVAWKGGGDVAPFAAVSRGISATAVSAASAVEVCQGWCKDTTEDWVPGRHCNLHGWGRLRAALQDENCATARQSPKNARLVGSKLQKLAQSSSFVFFRGAAGYFDYNTKCAEAANNYTGQDDVPMVVTNGDCHPENYGVMMMADGKLFWGVNDVDHAFLAPFTWDVLRGATGFVLACRDLGWNASGCGAYARAFVAGYIRGAKPSCTFTTDDVFIEGYPATQAPAAAMIKDAMAHSRRKDDAAATKRWLTKKGVNIKKREFERTPRVTPKPKLVEEFKDIVERYLYNGVPELVRHNYDGKKKGFWEVLDVAYVTGSGTGSIGLDRYYILILGAKEDRVEGSGLRILEMKQETTSVVERFFHHTYTSDDQGKRTVDAMRGAGPFANLFYGWVNWDGKSFLIREKSKYKGDVDIRDLKPKEMEEFAGNCGIAQAHYHLQVSCLEPSCSETQAANVDQEHCTKVSGWLRSNPTFEDEAVSRAEEEANLETDAHDRILKDHVDGVADPLSILNSPKNIC